MRRRTLLQKIVLLGLVSLIAVTISFGSFYIYWNHASPDKTCASCHEIEGAVHSLSQSAHQDLQCKVCHGTALSNGVHSLKEKSMMVFNHGQKNQFEKIRMNESQMLYVMDNCKQCHASEFSYWKSGGHSASYEDIFLNESHNKTERLNYDCLRCHGMFFSGIISDLVEPINKEGPWAMKDQGKAGQPTIPCMVCHQIHTEGEVVKRPDYANPASVFYTRNIPESRLSFYDRYEKVHISSVMLPKLQLVEGSRQVKVSDDYKMRNCVQCHAPDAWHEAGTSDDRTPRGVHEGFSCIVCHEPHSNDAKKSCEKCHPAISNCKLDVRTMNTTFFDQESPNNIHFVACTSCHHNDGRLKSIGK
jgi:hypothetical protein